MLALENENFQNVRTHSRKATCSKNSRILPSWNDVDDPTSAPKEMSPFLRVFHYSYESWVNDVYFGDLHRSFYNLHSSTPKKGREESSLHSIKSSLHTTAQSTASLPYYLPQDYFFNLWFTTYNRKSPCSKFYHDRRQRWVAVILQSLPR